MRPAEPAAPWEVGRKTSPARRHGPYFSSGKGTNAFDFYMNQDRGGRTRRYEGRKSQKGPQ